MKCGVKKKTWWYEKDLKCINGADTIFLLIVAVETSACFLLELEIEFDF